jgi:hypothetical protein
MTCSPSVTGDEEHSGLASCVDSAASTTLSISIRSSSGLSIDVLPKWNVAAIGHLFVSSKRSPKNVPVPRNSNMATNAFQ